jgi:PhnB protein
MFSSLYNYSIRRRGMSAKVNHVREGFSTITLSLCVDGAARAIEFYKQAFGATENSRMEMPDGKIAHAELKIGQDVIMLADEYPDMGFRSPRTLGGSPVTIHLYVEDVDAVVTEAASMGATLLRPVEDQFYGDRAGQIEDPFGHVWYIATHKEDVSDEEIMKRAAALYGEPVSGN